MRRLLTSLMAVAALSVPLSTAPLVAGPAGAAPSAPAPEAPPPLTRQAELVAAAKEFGVPAPVLLSVAYNESRWESHGGTPSTTAEYGVMGLTDLDGAQRAAAAVGRGETENGTATGAGTGAHPSASSPASLETAVTGARLAGVSVTEVRSSDAANIRAGAALLAAQAKRLNNGGLPSRVADWYGPVAGYPGSTDARIAKLFADAVFATLRTGAAATTADGQRLTLAAQPALRANAATASKLGLITPKSTAAECPSTLSCRFVAAAYTLADSSDPTSYGNYDIAKRRTLGPTIDSIVVHDVEGTYTGGIEYFQARAAASSPNYIVSSGGQVTQMVQNYNIAWHAGNWYVNMHSIGIEQEGYAIDGRWYTPSLYRATGALVKYLANLYHVPLDRGHILGHDNVPARTASGIGAMHWDPGPFWDWSQLMIQVGRPLINTAAHGNPIRVITPPFPSNRQSVTDCEGNGNKVTGATSFGWLRTSPSPSAPLFGDPGLHSSSTGGSSCAADWGDKAVAGQKVAVAQVRKIGSDEWLAIYVDGYKVWYWNGNAGVGWRSKFAGGQLAVVKAGRTAVPVYGVAYPEGSAWPSNVPVHTMTPLGYSFTGYQSYPILGTARADYYYSSTINGTRSGDRTEVRGTTKFYKIQLGHRVAFVKASDVAVHNH